MGRSAFLGSRAVHIVSASMSKLSSTGNPLGESGMAASETGCERSEEHRARARALALEVSGQGEHTTVAVPGADDLEPDGQAIRRPATRQRDRGMAGQVEGPEVRIPTGANRAGLFTPDRDRLERIVIDGQRGARHGRA